MQGIKNLSKSGLNRVIASTALLLAMTLSGTGPALAACPNPNPNPNVNLRVLQDFNGDCKSEIVWRYTDGSNVLWQMNGVSLLSSTPLLAAPYPWVMAGTGDFNGDGKADLLWRGPDGSVVVWLMDGGVITSSGSVLASVPFNWDIAGIGDFDGDGKSDILWRAADGTVVIWLMNGTALSSSNTVAKISTDWFIAGVGDFDGNGKSDILWRAKDSSVAIWLMNGPTIATSALLKNVPASWSVSLVGDFNGDGKADIFWRNADGMNAIWLMNGTTIATPAVVNVVPTSWEPSASGDFNGDGKTDIVWRNATDGSVAVWLMNGVAIGSSAVTTAVPDSGWAMLPPAPTASGSIPACTAVTPTDIITPSLVASRVSGVAPLAVFFDAVATTATTRSQPFHELEYRWHFGDAGSGPWTSTPDMPNLSRNLAMGPVAAHVFESPGTYNVCLSVFDGANKAIARAQITVQDPDVVFAGLNTICFSNNTDFTGCPAGGQKITTSGFASAMNNAAPGKRLLFKRGHTFTTTTGAALSVNGPGSVGAFGTGAKPIISATSAVSQVLRLSSSVTPTIKDWRFMDLDVRGPNSNTMRAFSADGGFDQLTFVRVNVQDLSFAFEFSGFVLDYDNGGTTSPHHVWDQLTVVDSTISNMLASGGFSGGYGGYISGTRVAWLGNVISNMTNGEHGLRFPMAAKAVVSHNRMSDAGVDKQAFTLRGPCQGGSGCTIKPVEGPYTELVVVSDNKFVGGNFSWTVMVGPENDTADERIRRTLWERNWFTAGSATQVSLVIAAPETTVRNNLCDMTGGWAAVGETCFSVVARGIAPSPDSVRIHNNTAYTADVTTQFQVVSLDSVATNASVINNIGSALFALPTIVGAPSGLVLSNNLLNGLPATLFVDATPALPVDYNLKVAPNPARDTGLASLSLFSDFFRQRRLQTETIDRGALKGN